MRIAFLPILDMFVFLILFVNLNMSKVDFRRCFITFIGLSLSWRWLGVI